MTDEIKTNELPAECYGFKAYEPGLVCKGKQYEEGKTYEEEGGEICSKGMMHYCPNPFDCLDYYPLITDDGHMTEFTKVTAIEQPVTDDKKKYATKKLQIGAKLSFKGFVEAAVEFIHEKTLKDSPKSAIDTGDSAQIGSSGNYAQIGSSGNYAQIGSSGGYAQIGSSGDYAKIGSSGNYAQIGSSGYSAQIGSSGGSAKIGSSGNYAQIGSSGNYAQIGSSGGYAQIGSSGYSAQIGSSGGSAKIGSSGDYAKINVSGSDSVVAAVGIESRIKAALGNWITLAEWRFDENKSRWVPVCVKSALVDGETIKTDVWYILRGGEFVEAERKEADIN